MSTEVAFPGVHYVRRYYGNLMKHQEHWTQAPIVKEIRENLEWYAGSKPSNHPAVISLPSFMIDELIEVIPPDLRLFDDDLRLIFLGWTLVPIEEESLC